LKSTIALHSFFRATFFVLFAGLLTLASPAAAQHKYVVRHRADSTRAITPTTQPAVPFRAPAPARYRELRARKDLQYHPPNYQPALTFWDRFWRRFWQALDWFFNRPGVGLAFEWIWYALLLSAVIWVVFKVLKLDVGTAFGRAPRVAPKYEVETAESPFTDDLAARLAEAEAAGNYRLAVRLGYLTALRQLADRDLVRWLPDKTNIQYVRELPIGPLRDQFARLTRQFEVAWYGEIYPTATDYASVRETRTAVARALGNASSFSAPAAAAR
jgi:Domain of unknown function (DUF4129)